MSILQNVTALQAARQLHVSEAGLRTAIEHLTTGRRVNRASDDAAGLVNGSVFEANARRAREAVKGFQNTYYAAQASDGFLEEATQLSYRLAELEGSGNSASAEYTAIQTQITAVSLLGGATVAAGLAIATLSTINVSRTAISSVLANANSNASVQGITSENNFAQADTIFGADIGQELINLTKYQILSQSGTQALSNANQAAQLVLGLFR